MNEFTILHTADWHVCDEFLNDAMNCLEFLVDKAEKLRPDLIAISGDIYNHRQVRQESEAARLAFTTVKNLARIAPVSVLVGTPSHDGNAPLLIESINEAYPVMVANLPTSSVLYAERFGTKTAFKSPLDTDVDDTMEPVAFISTAPAFTKQYFQSDSDIRTADQEIAKQLGAIFAMYGNSYREFSINLRRDPDRHDGPIPHILQGHWSIGGAFIHPSQAITGLDIEIAIQHIALANPTIVCMGHIHAQQKIGSNIFYPGSLFATDFGEREAKGFYVHNLELVDMADHWEVNESNFIHTPSPMLIKLTSDLLNASQEGTANIAILAALKGLSANPHAIIRHEVKIYQDMAHTIDQDMIKQNVKDNLGPRKFDLEINSIPRPNVRSARVLEVDTLPDKLTTRAMIIDEPISDGVLEKARMVESMEREEVLDMVQKGVQL